MKINPHNHHYPKTDFPADPEIVFQRRLAYLNALENNDWQLSYWSPSKDPLHLKLRFVSFVSPQDPEKRLVHQDYADIFTASGKQGLRVTRTIAEKEPSLPHPTQHNQNDYFRQYASVVTGSEFEEEDEFIMLLGRVLNDFKKHIQVPKTQIELEEQNDGWFFKKPFTERHTIDSLKSLQTQWLKQFTSHKKDKTS